MTGAYKEKKKLQGEDLRPSAATQQKRENVVLQNHKKEDLKDKYVKKESRRH